MPWRRHSSGSFNPTGALFAVIASSCSDGRRPLEGQPERASDLEPLPTQNFCPYCGSASKWHTRLLVYRIESGKATDGLRRELVKSLPQSDNHFAVFEEKATHQLAFFERLDKISTGLDLENPVWLYEVSSH